MTQETPGQPLQPLLTVNDLAERLCCSPQAVRHMVQRRQVPFVRLTERKLRFDPAAINDWLAERQVQAAG
jgi:excisionase family DNA binding protein